MNKPFSVKYNFDHVCLIIFLLFTVVADNNISEYMLLDFIDLNNSNKLNKKRFKWNFCTDIKRKTGFKFIKKLKRYLLYSFRQL